jgi:hypothetical protein
LRLFFHRRGFAGLGLTSTCLTGEAIAQPSFLPRRIKLRHELGRFSAVAGGPGIKGMIICQTHDLGCGAGRLYMRARFLHRDGLGDIITQNAGYIALAGDGAGIAAGHGGGRRRRLDLRGIRLRRGG